MTLIQLKTGGSSYMSWMEKYNQWLNTPGLNQEIKNALLEKKDNQKELEDCFYKNLEFGTGGMRGEIGPGTNRMNLYTVRKASAGLAAYIENHGLEAKKRGA